MNDGAEAMRSGDVAPFADRLSALFDACRKHRRISVELLEYDCANDRCDCEDECRTQAVDVCAECLSLFDEVDDERTPDRVMADSCAILLAVEALEPTDG